jgi:hypothetical protein
VLGHCTLLPFCCTINHTQTTTLKRVQQRTYACDNAGGRQRQHHHCDQFRSYSGLPHASVLFHVGWMVYRTRRYSFM